MALPKPYYENENGKLFHGDALEILPLLAPYDFVFTDPPYGHNNNNGDLIHNREAALGRRECGESRGIANDGIEANELFKQILPIVRDGLRSGGCCCCCCCCGGGGPDPQFARWSLWMDEILEFKQMVVWDKGPIGMGWHYRRSYETVLVGMKKGAACKWYDTTQTIENIIRPRTGIPKIIPSSDQHPTAKPWSLAGHFIQLHTEKRDTVVDPFCGGGSTIVACERLNRKWFAIEIDEEFCRMTVKNIAAERKQLKLF